ncbi:Abi family protein [Acinetobacter guillouiae]|uniref:Abi family protein n=2 Tax=Acinetobacter TaxID=469 RepID=UPI003AF68CE4
MKDFSKNCVTVTPFLSSARLAPYKISFDVTNDHELLGAYAWSQQVAGALYPLFHFLEIFLRNAIDQEATKRFGQFWWDTISYDNSNYACTKFLDNIQKAKDKLENNWKKSEVSRLGLRSVRHITTTCPAFSHNEIIAATEFSTWTFILSKGFLTTSRANREDYLWPKSLGKVFKQYGLINSNQTQALYDIQNLINEIRDYRNRVFHHEPIWMKGTTHGLNSVRSIQTIRQKINKIEDLIKIIGNDVNQCLQDANIFKNVRRVCSINELEVYQGKTKNISFSQKQKRLLRKKLSFSKKHDETVIIEYDQSVFGLIHMV